MNYNLQRDGLSSLLNQKRKKHLFPIFETGDGHWWFVH